MISPVRYVLLGSAPFATPVLRRLLDSPHRALAVLTPPDRPRGRGRSVQVSSLVQLARERDLRVLQPADPHEEAVLEELRALAPDVHLVASFGVIMHPELFDLPPHGSMNVHASLLPRHRGAAPIQRAILAGDGITGVSVQRIVQALDEGDVLLEHRLEIGPRETAGELADRLALLGGEAAVEALDRLESGRARFTPQDPDQATYARKLRKKHGRIDWSQPAERIDRRVRAMTPWPGAKTTDPRGRVLGLLAARPSSPPEGAPAGAAPGEVLEAGPRLVVATGEGALELLEVQPAGKRAMPSAEWLRGARIEPGSRLGEAPPAGREPS